ncbi:hypothetical protein LPJ63_005078 [Coemansia sp. RSA 2711]|nr:hypothetical protein LPJ63_005078 [Coemansia sp. RSA 2711]KAJ2323168.1 hypothetical protein IWW51_003890 [Coemansia sp. RSA 2702]
MSFEFTQQEKTRVTLAMLGGVKLDPIGHIDLAVIVVLSLVYLVNFIAVAFLIYNRNYPPLKSKYPFLMGTIMVSMFVYFLGDLVLKSHVHVRGPLLSNCMLFCVWLRIVLGAYTVSVLTTIRSYALFCIFVCNRAFRGKYVYVSTGLALLLAVVFVIVTYTMPGEESVRYVGLIEMCSMSYTYRAIVQGLLWLVWLVNALLNFRLRHINSSFNESREMFVACVCVFTLLAFNTAILYAFPLYPTRVYLRATETLCSHLIANFLWWFIMFSSIYNCAVRRTAYLSEWKDTLMRDGLQKQYQIARTDPFSLTMVSVDSHVGKLVTLPRAMVTDHDGFDARTSFSQASSPCADDVPAYEAGLWRPESARRQSVGSQKPGLPGALASHESTSATTVNEQPLEHYNFPMPPK